MTATMKPDAKEREIPREPSPHAVPAGSPADLLGAPLKRRDVVIRGKKYWLRELRQAEAEDISHASLKTETDAAGKDLIRADFRGRQARAIACAWIHEDGRQVFDHPLDDGYLQVNQMSPSIIRALFKVVDELSAVTEAEKDELGKDSGPTASAAG